MKHEGLQERAGRERGKRVCDSGGSVHNRNYCGDGGLEDPL